MLPLGDIVNQIFNQFFLGHRRDIGFDDLAIPNAVAAPGSGAYLYTVQRRTDKVHIDFRAVAGGAAKKLAPLPFQRDDFVGGDAEVLILQILRGTVLELVALAQVEGLRDEAGSSACAPLTDWEALILEDPFRFFIPAGVPMVQRAPDFVSQIALVLWNSSRTNPVPYEPPVQHLGRDTIKAFIVGHKGAAILI